MRKIFFLICLLAIGAFLRLNNLSERSLWTDEFFTLFDSSGHAVEIKDVLSSLSQEESPVLLKAKDFKPFLKNDSNKNIQDVTESLLYTDTHPPLYFWLMHIWMRIFGDSAWVIRFFSVLMGLAAILLAYLVGVYLFNRQIAYFCALFVSISPFAVRYSQEARAYALIMALGLLSWLFALRFEKYNKNQDIFCFAIINALGIYAHYFYVFIAIAQFLYFTIIYDRDSLRLNKFYLGFLGSLLLVCGWIIPLILRGYNFRNTEWIFGYPGLFNKIVYLCRGAMHLISIFNKPQLLQYLFVVVGLFCLIYLVLAFVKEGIRKHPHAFLFSLIMFLMPLAAMFFIDVVEQGALLRQERFWMFPFLGFLPLAGYFLGRGFFEKRPAAIILMFLMLVSSFTVSKAQFGPAPEYTSQWINKESGKNSAAVIVYNIRSAVLPQAYYLDDEIYLMPVSDSKQLRKSLELAAAYAEKIFIVRHYHPSDPSLIDQPFMAAENIEEAGFKLKKDIRKDDISVSEYVRCVS